MKFSMIFEAQLVDPTPERERQVIHDCVEQAVFAEEMGFDRIWAVEHHSLTQYAHLTASEIFLAWVAARTRTIRIGHGVVTMPFGYQHPVRVAERAAMLDVLSGGRVDVGAGRGATRQEMSMFGVRPQDTRPQTEEALRIFAAAWREPEFEWHGSLDIGPGAILPRPVQEPHPPLFMACSQHESLGLAAELGIGALVMGFSGADDVRAMRTVYDEAIAARDGGRFVSTEVNDHFSALCPTIVLDDAERALRLGTRGQRFFAESIAHWYGGGPAPTGYAEDAPAEEHVEALAKGREELVAKLHEANIPARPVDTGTFNADHAYGSAETAVAYVERLREIGVDEVMCLIQMGTVPQEACMETIRQWGEKVIPHFRALEG
ncbi:LLM class flavin-dependent oxidoreductase [Streptomyces antarcticus]|uniref:LLM class flavin-dependent oxidoreductase n=1 Tax=Streptomyces antarcticus TaxID=2996458 RepID=UPI0022703155|nr:MULTISPECIES: LLM class flavin-dependent oxidoreductase [unclassified Streptomyces]MCY0942830.1 LLM class flavin-dependent oxidoreductase [Streptomyces sp. H34-AA3]MCY0951097.1 LLM class flavin-dependent oxidoreductase [Streptomyces sp. H27-S2]MCZ4085936.1 LLM class flavin-dependent oxidoreductase [Streptomyces sp. H34-S5]